MPQDLGIPKHSKVTSPSLHGAVAATLTVSALDVAIHCPRLSVASSVFAHVFAPVGSLLTRWACGALLCCGCWGAADSSFRMPCALLDLQAQVL